MQNTSPQSFLNEAQSDDSGPADREDQKTNATLGVLARPIMEAPESPQNASLGLLAQPVLGEQSQHYGSTPQNPMSPQQRMSPPSLSPLQQSLPPHHLSPQKHSTLSYHQSVDTLPQSPPAEHCSPGPSCSFTSTMSTPHKKPTDDNSSSSDSSEIHFSLREYLRVGHDVHPAGDPSTRGKDNEPGVTTHKVKTYRCKQCEFSTITKLEFWEHTRGHIKPERLLTCPQCPFVTEYKHHLEYHLRNHFGSKPFKCDKCSYSCVNKSMLNSHLKSHSSVYQFRCLDCEYASKYCHSLKAHLRKCNHKPAVVLNPDGSENPLPIVDVYGTRRGPKRTEKTEEASSSELCQVPSLNPMFSSPYGFMPSQTFPYPYHGLMNPFSRSPLIPFPSNPIMQVEHNPPKTVPENSFYNTAISNIQQSTINNYQEGVKEYLTRMMSTQQDIIARTSTAEGGSQSTEASHGAPLDLSRPEPQEQAAETVGRSPDQSSVTKSRRKGKAIKLERIAQRLQQQTSDTEPSPKQLKFNMSTDHPKANEEDEPRLASSLTDSEDNDPSSTKVNITQGERVSEEWKTRWRKEKEVFECPYCDLLFGDVVMHSIHMGCHYYENPFTCKICGHQTADRVQFFIHLIRQGHNYLF